MCIIVTFEYTECRRLNNNSASHYSDPYTIPCIDVDFNAGPDACRNQHNINIRWFSSYCDACFTSQNNHILDYSDVDMARLDLVAPARRLLQVFMSHSARHGTDSPYYLKASLFSNLPKEYLEEVYTICQELQNKVKWDSRKINKEPHSLEEKRLITYLRAAVQACVVRIFGSLPKDSTNLPYSIFLSLSPADRNAIFRQVFIRKVVIDRTMPYLVTCPCACGLRYRKDVEQMEVTRQPEEPNPPATRWFEATCQDCRSKFIMLRVFAQPAPEVMEGKPWWLPVLSGDSIIPAQGERQGSVRLVKHASMYIRKKGESLVRKLTGKLTRTLISRKNPDDKE
ncbi:uncharacterized protein PAC_14162 [Phialocephala subalpina]|uniref:Uncharacterized protein n=1 Tax=Phialocephala subalpina TaxID=576137 RepID=A0A1L7XGW5_9HELO|nr:uncharacterized protein PAC_14162 [Phialocephala subalpina]